MKNSSGLSDDMEFLTRGILSASLSQTDPAFGMCGIGRPVFWSTFCH